MSGITEFILARVEEAEQIANAAHAVGYLHSVVEDEEYTKVGTFVAVEYMNLFSLNDPPSVLAECEAKRKIIELIPDMELAEICEEQHDLRLMADEEKPSVMTLRALAAVYKDHPEYKQEWAL